MNYRHVYHAGNFADVVKHLTLVLILEYMQKKEGGICMLDAHGGIGVYNLNSEQAQKTAEWEDGIGRICSLKENADQLQNYVDVVRPYLNTGYYPGSPRLMADLLRTQDRLVANELHPDDFHTLVDTLSEVRNARCTNLDAYEFLRANLPPKEKRGLVLIDPPFEKKDEFQKLARQIKEWKRRFPTGVYVIWYPIKPHLDIPMMKRAVTEQAFANTWCLEIMKHPPLTPDVLNGCGLIILNAPYSLADWVRPVMPVLKESLGLYSWDFSELSQRAS